MEVPSSSSQSLPPSPVQSTWIDLKRRRILDLIDLKNPTPADRSTVYIYAFLAFTSRILQVCGYVYVLSLVSNLTIAIISSLKPTCNTFGLDDEPRVCWRYAISLFLESNAYLVARIRQELMASIYYKVSISCVSIWSQLANCKFTSPRLWRGKISPVLWIRTR